MFWLIIFFLVAIVLVVKEKEGGHPPPPPPPRKPERVGIKYRILLHEEIEAELDSLFRDNPWAEHPVYPVADWQYEVANGDTRQGYRGWLYNKIANEED